MPVKIPRNVNFRLPKITRTPSKTEKLILHALSSLLLFLTGIVLFIVGLTLCTMAYQWFPGNSTIAGNIIPIAVFLIGLGFVTGGFLIVYWRRKKNSYIATY